MNRYATFRLVGYPIVEGSHPTGERYFRSRARRHEPVTTWYVVDNEVMGEVVAAYTTKGRAQWEAVRLNAQERADQKRWERERDRPGASYMDWERARL